MSALSSGFRFDINALRAIAVLAVMVFHFNSDWLPGGFAGVDVFFVISGYLMTSIIVKGVQKNNFSFSSFYLSRAKRIVPALLFVISIVLLLGYAVLEPMSYAELGKHSRDSLLFFSNFTYLRELDYFGIENSSKILLHTWSLSVEWQFYLVYPVFLFALIKIFGLNVYRYVFVVLLIAFTFASFYMSYSDPQMSYFSFFSRAWEMMLGGLPVIFLLKVERNLFKGFISSIGCISILLSFFLVGSQTVWPGPLTVLSVLGALFVILGNVSYLFSFSIVQYLGRISYSLYLVHWPVIALSAMIGFKLEFAPYLLLTFALSFLVYQLVERRRGFSYVFVVFYCLLVLLSHYVSVDGVKKRVPEQYAMGFDEFKERYSGSHGFNGSSTVNIFNGGGRILLFGDSYAMQYSRFIVDAGIAGYGLFKTACMSNEKYFTYRNLPYHDALCSDYYKVAGEYIESADVLVFGQSWGGSTHTVMDRSTGDVITNERSQQVEFVRQAVLNLIKKLTARQSLVLIGDSAGRPKGGSYECLGRGKLLAYKYLPVPDCILTQVRRDSSYNAVLSDIAKNYDNVYFVNPNDSICSADICYAVNGSGLPFFIDNTHLSIFGAELVGEKMHNLILKILSNR